MAREERRSLFEKVVIRLRICWQFYELDMTFQISTSLNECEESCEQPAFIIEGLSSTEGLSGWSTMFTFFDGLLTGCLRYSKRVSGELLAGSQQSKLPMLPRRASRNSHRPIL